MAKSAYRTWTVGEIVTAAMLNEQIRDNGNEIWQGTTAGDMDYYTDATHKTRIPIGAENSTLTVVSGVPAWQVCQSCGIYHTAAVSINNEADTILGTMSERWDTAAFHSGSDAAVTIPADGLYLMTGKAIFDTGAAGANWKLYIRSATYGNIGYQSLIMADSSTQGATVSAVYYLSAADTVAMYVYQDSGSAQQISSYMLTITRIK